MTNQIIINGNRVNVSSDDPDMPLLWLLRDKLDLTGTKYGCGIGMCGACSVHVNGELMRACSVTVAQVTGKQITTIEGLTTKSGQPHPVQQAWLAADVPQCGYCQAGQIMATAAFLKQHPHPTDKDIDRNMVNICRCGTYPRIRTAIHDAASKLARDASL